jgi:hypothetical protein
MVVIGVSFATACRSGGLRSWAGPRIPLAPAIHFAEQIEPRTLAVLVLDGHTGAPARHGVAQILTARLTVATDSMGTVRLRLPRAGTYNMRVVGIGYEEWHGAIAVTDSTGAAMVVQLRRSYAAIHAVNAGTGPPLNELPRER